MIRSSLSGETKPLAFLSHQEPQVLRGIRLHSKWFAHVEVADRQCLGAGQILERRSHHFEIAGSWEQPGTAVKTVLIDYPIVRQTQGAGVGGEPCPFSRLMAEQWMGSVARFGRLIRGHSYVSPSRPLDRNVTSALLRPRLCERIEEGVGRCVIQLAYRSDYRTH